MTRKLFTPQRRSIIPYPGALTPQLSMWPRVDERLPDTLHMPQFHYASRRGLVVSCLHCGRLVVVHDRMGREHRLNSNEIWETTSTNGETEC